VLRIRHTTQSVLRKAPCSRLLDKRNVCSPEEHLHNLPTRTLISHYHAISMSEISHTILWTEWWQMCYTFSDKNFPHLIISVLGKKYRCLPILHMNDQSSNWRKSVAQVTEVLCNTKYQHIRTLLHVNQSVKSQELHWIIQYFEKNTSVRNQCHIWLESSFSSQMCLNLSILFKNGDTIMEPQDI
jgi:hypothetical protein